ncbi:MAG: DMT family transporter, partial [Chloroflexi bacterium]
MRKQSFAPDLAALLVVIVWGVNFPFLKLAINGFGLLPFAFLRFAGMLALGWLVLAVRPAGRIERRDWPRVAASGLLGYTCYISGSLAGIYFTTAFNNALLIAAAPVFSILLLWLFRVEPIGLWRAAGMTVSFVGIGIFVGAVAGGSPVGNLLNIAAAFFFAAYSVVNKPLVSRYPATVVTAWTLTIGSIPILLVSAPSLLT